MPARRTDLTAALPDLASPQRLRGLIGQVDVWRDPDGAPHARARSLHDAFFAQGFVHAQDRLWHMEYDRRRALGRWAELAGASAVPQDILARRLGLGRSARADYEGAAHETRGMLDAYAAGVNAFLETTRAWPVELQLLGDPPGALGAVGQPGRLQDPSRGDGPLADEDLARPPRPLSSAPVWPPTCAPARLRPRC